MIIIADSGSTKTDWAFMPDATGSCGRFSSLGYNPNFISASDVRSDILASLPEDFVREDVREVYFYGSGVDGSDVDSMRQTLAEVFSEAETIYAADDLLAAARALLGDDSGFAAILGTGTNSCLYDGMKVTMKVSPLGFVLGDEGSGGYIGKILLRDYARRNMPADVYAEVDALVGKNVKEIIEQVYRKPKPNRYCAWFCTWVGEHRDVYPYCRNLIMDAFRDFFRNIVTLYPDYQKYSLNCVGSVGYCNKEILAEVASEFGMSMGRVIKSPLDGLVEYHSHRLKL